MNEKWKMAAEGICEGEVGTDTAEERRGILTKVGKRDSKTSQKTTNGERREKDVGH